MCCYRCEHHLTWSGIWQCSYITPEQKREETLRRIRDREQIEITKSAAEYKRQKQKYAIERAKKAARAKNKARQANVKTRD